MNKSNTISKRMDVIGSLEKIIHLLLHIWEAGFELTTCDS